MCTPAIRGGSCIMGGFFQLVGWFGPGKSGLGKSSPAPRAARSESVHQTSTSADNMGMPILCYCSAVRGCVLIPFLKHQPKSQKKFECFGDPGIEVNNGRNFFDLKMIPNDVLNFRKCYPIVFLGQTKCVWWVFVSPSKCFVWISSCGQEWHLSLFPASSASRFCPAHEQWLF